MIYHLPQFPLQLVVFPGETVNLHVFEERYKDLVTYCDKNNQSFGIPAFINDKVQEIGSKMKLQRIVKTYEDGRMDISTSAISLYRIHEFQSVSTNHSFPGAMVQDVQTTGEEDQDLANRIALLVKELFDILKLNRPQEVNLIDVFAIVHKLGLTLEEEYAILASLDLVERQNIIIDRLDKLIPAVRDAEFLRRKIQMNGYFKHIIPPDIE